MQRASRSRPWRLVHLAKWAAVHLCAILCLLALSASHHPRVSLFTSVCGARAPLCMRCEALFPPRCLPRTEDERRCEAGKSMAFSASRRSLPSSFFSSLQEEHFMLDAPTCSLPKAEKNEENKARRCGDNNGTRLALSQPLRVERRRARYICVYAGERVRALRGRVSRFIVG